jgi:hypothetical protein
MGRYANSPMQPGSRLTFAEMLIKEPQIEASSIEEADVIIFCDYLEDDLKLVEDLKVPTYKRMILLMEPTVVLPVNSSRKIRESFGKVIEVGRPEEINRSVLKWPQYWRNLSSEEANRNSEEIVIVAGNKLSFIPGELYSLRRIAAFEIKDIALFGTAWNIKFGTRVKKFFAEALIAIRAGYLPKLGSVRYWFTNMGGWHGAPGNKHETLEKYRYSLVIENSAEFLSEKLFDSFFAGCIPVYVGPSLHDFGIPSALVVTASPDIDSINSAIIRAKKVDYSRWIVDLEKWLMNADTRDNWSTENFFLQIAISIKELANQNQKWTI